MVASNLALPRSGVKVLSAVSGDLYKSYIAGTTSAADALLMHDGEAHSFLYAIKSALSLGSFKQVLNTFQICAMGIGVALVAALSLVSGLQHLNCVQIIFTQIFFMAVSVFTVSGGHAVRNREIKTAKNKRRSKFKKKS